MFRFQVHFNKNGRSTRQSVLDTVDVSPLSLNRVSTDYQGVLEPGSYTVSVTAVNEHGSSSSMMSEQFSVQGILYLCMLAMFAVVGVSKSSYIFVFFHCSTCSSSNKQQHNYHHWCCSWSSSFYSPCSHSHLHLYHLLQEVLEDK